MKLSEWRNREAFSLALVYVLAILITAVVCVGVLCPEPGDISLQTGRGC